MALELKVTGSKILDSLVLVTGMTTNYARVIKPSHVADVVYKALL
jgi:hypothetical protein